MAILTDLQKAARWYGKNGLCIFPAKPRGKDPLTAHGFTDASSDAQQIEDWWKAYPDANIGLSLGPAKLLLVDLDFCNGSVVEDRGDFVRLYGQIPDTCEVVTGSGSRHIYFGFKGGRVPKQLAKGIELKAEGGYAILPPSIHPCGSPYSFDGATGAKALLSPADCPTRLLKAIAEARRGHTKDEAAGAADAWTEGERNTRLTSWAGKLRRDGLNLEKIRATLLVLNETCCRPPLPKTEVEKIARNMGRYAPGSAASAFDATVPLDQVDPSLELLNDLPVFRGRIAFRAVKKRGSMLIAETTEGREIIWPNAEALASFSKARAIIADAADIFLPTPAPRLIHTRWEPAAYLLSKLATADGIAIEPALTEEVRDLLRLMWRHAGQPTADDNAEFIGFMRAILASRRDPRGEKPTPPAVFIAEQQTWTHVPTLRAWLSLPAFMNKLYPLTDIRNGLLLLGFVYHENLRRRDREDTETLCLWCGPLGVLENE
jgi:hypothetical protein